MRAISGLGLVLLLAGPLGCAWATRHGSADCQAQMDRCTARCAPTPQAVSQAQLTPKGGSQTMSPCEQACYASCR